MTKQEAKKKECPKRIKTLTKTYTENRSDLWELKYSNCIASDCMMWIQELDLHGSKTTDGYCGLTHTA